MTAQYSIRHTKTTYTWPTFELSFRFSPLLSPYQHAKSAVSKLERVISSISPEACKANLTYSHKSYAWQLPKHVDTFLNVLADLLLICYSSETNAWPALVKTYTNRAQEVAHYNLSFIDICCKDIYDLPLIMSIQVPNFKLLEQICRSVSSVCEPGN